MGIPTIGASGESSGLAIVLYRVDYFAPAIDFYEENPVQCFRGLAFAMTFNLVLTVMSVGGWELWRAFV